AAIPPTERLITIEDSLELGLDLAHPECVAVQARPANIEGAGEITLAELVRHALRMSPARVIVGETRRPEPSALLNAMCMGTAASRATIHGSSSQGACSAIGACAVRALGGLGLAGAILLIASAVRRGVHFACGPHGARRVASSREAVGAVGALVGIKEFSPCT